MGSCLSIDESPTKNSYGSRRLLHQRQKQSRRQAAEFLAAEAKSNEILYRFPGRICANGASSNACIFTQQGRKGTNQDAMVVWENFASRMDTTFCGVFDGHGPLGHLVARKVRDSLPLKLLELWKSQVTGEKASIEEALTAKSPRNVNLEQHKMLAEAWKECIPKAYNAMDKELKTHPNIDCFCSGTTAVTMLLQGDQLAIGNVGDSRAVLGTLSDKTTVIEAVQLTVDLKPNLPVEAERIKRCKGRVFALDDEPEVARVWLPHDDSPGLAMARAFGDFCLKDFGLIAVPEITCRQLTEKDQFVVLASDGVWDVLSNKEVVEAIWAAPTRTTAARSLVETAVRAWRLKYPTSKVDDCAVVCLYLHPQRRPTTGPSVSVTNVLPEETSGSSNSTTTSEEHSGSISSSDADSSSSSVSSDNGLKIPATVVTAVMEEAAPSEITVVSTTTEEEEDEAHFSPVQRTASRRSLAECLSTADEDEWSALEGVARVNSLLKLPRFLLGGDARASTSKRRH